MERIWTQYTKVGFQRRPQNYHDFHSEGLFIAVMEDVEAVLKRLAIGDREGEWKAIS
jgi:hypothetical protein